MTNSILLPVLYAGLGGTLLALIVATAQNRWSPRVFFLLALRLAIGWHFLFEGLYKVHSHYVGPTETTRKFTSEPYFKVAPGPVGALMRKQFDDPAPVLDARVRATRDLTPAAFDKLTGDQQAEACPEAAARDLDVSVDQVADAIKADAAAEAEAATAAEKKAVEYADAAEQRALKGEWTDAEKADIRAKGEADRAKAKAAADGRRDKARLRVAAYRDLGRDLLTAVKAKPGGDALAGQLEAVLQAIKTETDAEVKAATAAEEKAVADATAAEARALKGEWSAAEKAKLTEKAEADRAKARAKADKDRQAAKEKGDKARELAPLRITAAKAAYARWVYGVDGRDTKVKGVTGDVSFTAPQRLAHLDWLRREVAAQEDRDVVGLGNGFGINQKRAAEWRTEYVAAESDLARDALAFTAELRKALTAGKAPDEPPAPKPGERMDKFTMWFLVGVGGCLLAGLLTRVVCVLGTGFLLMTYLAHPPFPWYPLPPNTEGNPLFVNKNVIEGLALLTLATFPTGRWLGLDALIARCCGCRRGADATA